MTVTFFETDLDNSDCEFWIEPMPWESSTPDVDLCIECAEHDAPVPDRDEVGVPRMITHYRYHPRSTLSASHLECGHLIWKD